MPRKKGMILEILLKLLRSFLGNFSDFLLAFSDSFNWDAKSPELIIFILQLQISKYVPIKTQYFASQNPRSTSQLAPIS